MESLITMLGQSLVIRCEAILDRLPADVRAMPVRDFLRIHGGKITGILRPAGEIEGRRSTIASRRGTVTVRGDEEDEEERMRKR